MSVELQYAIGAGLLSCPKCNGTITRGNAYRGRPGDVSHVGDYVVLVCGACGASTETTDWTSFLPEEGSSEASSDEAPQLQIVAGQRTVIA